jgi:serine/threonine-protein kinase RsbW
MIRNVGDLRFGGPAKLEALEQFCDRFRCWAAEVQLPDRFSVELLLREALTNAVVHGCVADAALNLECVLRMRGSRLLIAVRDDGPGFDWRRAGLRRASLQECSGRGLEIYRLLASRVRFNERGNSVVLIKRF